MAHDTALTMLARRLPLFRSPRAVRLVCGALALMLVASNTLAAMGICIAKAPAVVTTADAPCPQHDGDSQPASPPAAHCPQDDPGVQSRSADLPAAHFDAVPAFGSTLVLRRAPSAASATATGHVPPEPLYARLSRLLL